MDSYCIFEEDYPDIHGVYESNYDREEDEFVMDCGDPGCLMPGEHFRSECYTLEMAEAWERQFKKTPRLRRVRSRRQ